MKAYQIIPDEELIKIEKVRLTLPQEEILSEPDIRVLCSLCAEEIINKREIIRSVSFSAVIVPGIGTTSRIQVSKFHLQNNHTPNSFRIARLFKDALGTKEDILTYS